MSSYMSGSSSLEGRGQLEVSIINAKLTCYPNCVALIDGITSALLNRPSVVMSACEISDQTQRIKRILYRLAGIYRITIYSLGRILNIALLSRCDVVVIIAPIVT